MHGTSTKSKLQQIQKMAFSDGLVVSMHPRALTKAALLARAASIALAGAVRNFPPRATPPGDG